MPPATNDLDTWLDGLVHDPEVFPHQLDTINRQLLLVRLAADQVQNAAFLDQRVLSGREAGAWIPLDRVLSMVVPPNQPAGLILHCGHTGSTLISRLLGEFPGVWSLREPLLLQALAAEARVTGTPLARLRSNEFHALLGLSQKLLAKSPPNHAQVIIKHTSLTANLAPGLLGLPGSAAIICLWIPLPDYLAIMLREPSVRSSVRIAAGEWIRDLMPTLGTSTPVLGESLDAELAALNWCAAQFAFAQARSLAPERVIGLDFTDFLETPEEHLGIVARHFGTNHTEQDIERALCSPWMQRYAKDPRYPFDTAERAREIETVKSRLSEEVRLGVKFAQRLWQLLPMTNAFTQPG
ncbi:MAG TPA: hypothetical protein VFA48_12860 [Gammaproteobacteria bacterium]|nr:hypothetical protein [Gammaproteobacteria bacterium]